MIHAYKAIGKTALYRFDHGNAFVSHIMQAVRTGQLRRSSFKMNASAVLSFRIDNIIIQEFLHFVKLFFVFFEIVLI